MADQIPPYVNKKARWDDEEDQILHKLVESFGIGTASWSLIAEGLNNHMLGSSKPTKIRTSAACHERWYLLCRRKNLSKKKEAEQTVATDMAYVAADANNQLSQLAPGYECAGNGDSLYPLMYYLHNRFEQEQQQVRLTDQEPNMHLDENAIADNEPYSQLQEVEPFYDTTKQVWSEDDDKLLVKLIQTHGPRNWEVVAGHFPGRTECSCKKRWYSALKHVSDGQKRKREECNPYGAQDEITPALAHSVYAEKPVSSSSNNCEYRVNGYRGWTRAEDKRLEELVNEVGTANGSWTIVAARLVNAGADKSAMRTPTACAQHWYSLQKKRDKVHNKLVDNNPQPNMILNPDMLFDPNGGNRIQDGIRLSSYGYGTSDSLVRGDGMGVYEHFYPNHAPNMSMTYEDYLKHQSMASAKDMAVQLPQSVDLPNPALSLNAIDSSRKSKGQRYKHWTKNDDMKMIELVNVHGTNNWGAIASSLGRSIRSCQDHWYLVLLGKSKVVD